ncbi:Alpha/beta hydrolase family protein [Thalassoglobus neptunius]|uniref:Alpha/beta hydrolase family protein n=1 Tax=Thalassoglobus neptunius TaxID=1938619 RepID=A0A5C5W8M7_9PLAN|nr:prolyl oligopeptidase family serine peptidase [Thalassoglobus neptunius]TWT46381.1 Alpha/beta hydrolase family protein [Thalassoglobus neptunius]
MSRISFLQRVGIPSATRMMAFLILCTQVLSAEPPVASSEERPLVVADVVYGHKDGLAMTFDIFRPDTESTGRPANGAAIAFMVSGGWYSKWTPPQQAQAFFQPYLNEGYTVFAVRHGSSPVYGIPDAVSDVQRAIRFIRLNSYDFGIAPDRIGVMGMSAGGHLSLMLATTGDDGDPAAVDPVLRTGNRVAAVAALVPPSDLRVAVWEAEESLPAYRNFPALNLSVEEAAKYSPLLFVTSDDAPALIISGTLDDLVPPRHGEWIAAEYEKNKLDHQLLLLEANHGLNGKQAEAFQAVIGWFNEHLLESDSSSDN